MKYKNYVVHIFLLVQLIVGSNNVYASGIINMGFAGGGDTLAERTDGVTLKAGGGLSFELGLEISEPDDPLVFQFLAGTKFDSVSASSKTAKINSNPLHGLIMLRNGKALFGGGIAYYLNPTYKDPYGNTANYDNALGYVLAGDYGFARGTYMGLRYTSIKFKGVPLIDSSGRFYNETDASSFALVLGYKF